MPQSGRAEACGYLDDVVESATNQMLLQAVVRRKPGIWAQLLILAWPRCRRADWQPGRLRFAGTRGMVTQSRFRQQLAVLDDRVPAQCW